MKQLITIVLAFVMLQGCAAGSSIVTGSQRPAISTSEVKVYLDEPADYETIGIVEATGEVAFSRQATQNKVIEKLKSRAAKIGANGVLLLSSGSQPGTSTSGFTSGDFFFSGSNDKLTAQGRAIYVNEK